jgi:hypothetical protein
MSTILDLLYREYCRARLAEMRKQLLLSAANDETATANWDAGGLDDRDRGAGDDTANQPQPSAIGIGSVDEVLGIVTPLEHHG